LAARWALGRRAGRALAALLGVGRVLVNNKECPEGRRFDGVLGLIHFIISLGALSLDQMRGFAVFGAASKGGWVRSIHGPRYPGQALAGITQIALLGVSCAIPWVYRNPVATSNTPSKQRWVPSIMSRIAMPLPRTTSRPSTSMSTGQRRRSPRRSASECSQPLLMRVLTDTAVIGWT